MSSLVSNIIGAIIQSLTAIIFINTFLEKSRKVFLVKISNLLSFIVFSFVILLVYQAEYSAINPMLFLILMIICLVYIYKINFSESVLLSGLFLVFLFISDLLTSLIFVRFSSIEAIRTRPIFIIISNLCVGLIEIILINVRWIKRKTLDVIRLNQNKVSKKFVAFIVLLTAALIFSVYILFENFIINKMFFAGIICIVIFIILGFIYFKEKYEKDVIINRYDQLFDCVKTFEEWMDNENVNIHESKNQLATLREMIKNNKKAINYIDNIIKDNINLEEQNIQKLKNIPKGGLKGLLYYKINLIVNNNITLFLDITKDVKNELVKLTLEENKTLCRLVGIFFDNAIESSKESEKKLVSCEIYINNNNIVITIANTYKGKIELNKLNNNGYSTKGKNRGKGLYLVNKIINKEKIFSLDNRIINNYYIQKIVIKKGLSQN